MVEDENTATAGGDSQKQAESSTASAKMEDETQRAAPKQETPSAARAMGEALGANGTAVRDDIVGSFQTNEIETEIVARVRDAITNTLRATGSVGDDATSISRDVAKGALAAMEKTGISLPLSAKGIAKGVVMAISDVDGDITTVTRPVVGAIVERAAPAGANLTVVARRAVDGAVEAAGEIDTSMVVEVARNAATGAIEGAGSAGNTAINTVRNVLVGLAGGIRNFVNTTWPSRDMTPGPAEGESQTAS